MLEDTIRQYLSSFGIPFQYDNKIVVWENIADKIPPTREVTNKKIAELEAAEPMRILRIERNRRLAETDHFAFQDRIMTEEIKTYRQALRDLQKMITPDDSTEPLPAPTIDEQNQLIFLHWPEVPE